MTLQIYNTLTRKKETFKPLKQDKTKVYYCGPTPYNFAHIGNLRAYVFSDTVVRTLRFLGYPVETVMNITDIDDKTIRDSQKAGESLSDFTQKYTGHFLEDLEHLHVNHADYIVPISTLVPDMIAMIQSLLDKGYAYLAEDGSVYYSIKKFKRYGELAHLDMAGMKESVRINNDEYEKEQAADFALWKGYDSTKDGPNVWEAKFILPLIQGEPEGVRSAKIPPLTPPNLGGGREVILPGRPGWHIECSACNMHYFGEQIDLHMGGVDNIFPHHQNEIAQTEAITGKAFSKYWMHSGHLLVDNKKMAKSAGNFYTLRDVIAQTSDESADMVCRGFRLMSLQTRYRENFNFTFDRLRAAIQAIRSFDETFRRLKRYDARPGKVNRVFRDELQAYIQEYIRCLEDDIGTPEALAVVFDFLSFVNSKIDESMLSLEEKNAVIDLFRSFDQVLAIMNFGLLLSDDSAPEEILTLLAERNTAKSAKDYALADSLRDQITAAGWKIVDMKDGRSVVERV